MDVSLIVAAAENGTIGLENRLPWHLPEDLKYFRKVTMGKPIIMGRKTFDSIGKPLPGRTNIVLTRQQQAGLPETVHIAHDAEQAIQIARTVCQEQAANEIMVIGGEQVYQLLMPHATRLYLTEVQAVVEGDAHFVFDRSQWRLVSEEKHHAAGDNPYDYRFCILERT